MDVWSTGEESDFLMRSDRPTMKDIMNQLMNESEAAAGAGVEPTDTDPDPAAPARDESHPTIYKRRWYILLVFAVFNVVQGEASNTWVPIEDSAQFLFGWSDHTVALVANLAQIGYAAALPLGAWLLDARGLRAAVAAAALLVAVGTGLRCVTTDTPGATWLNCVAQVLIGFSGTLDSCPSGNP